MTKKSFKFNPRDFIGPPFSECPKCGAPNFGVLSIYETSYSKRCKDCWKTEQYNLPILQKKIIYLDQFAVSDMMKALNPKHKSHKSGKVIPFWKVLFEKLDRLCKLQLIICPKSQTHSRETQVSGDHDFIKRILDQLSHNLHFQDFQWIKQIQIHENLGNWLNATSEYFPSTDRKWVLEGNENAWTENLIITVKSRWDSQMLEMERKSRNQIAKEIVPLFDRWAGEKKSFDDLVEEEVLGFGIGILEAYKHYIQRFLNVSLGLESNYDPLALLPPNSTLLLQQIKSTLQTKGVDPSELDQKTIQYLSDPFIGKCPFLKIASHLWAAIARKASAGQKKPPNRGTNNDIETISSLLPYCDAMFIDNPCAAYLADEPLRTRLSKYGKIFSQHSKEEFIDYLDSIEKTAKSDHLKCVKEVYGEDVGKPYTTMFEIEKF